MRTLFSGHDELLQIPMSVRIPRALRTAGQMPFVRSWMLQDDIAPSDGLMALVDYGSALKASLDVRAVPRAYRGLLQWDYERRERVTLPWLERILAIFRAYYPRARIVGYGVPWKNDEDAEWAHARNALVPLVDVCTVNLYQGWLVDGGVTEQRTRERVSRQIDRTVAKAGGKPLVLQTWWTLTGDNPPLRLDERTLGVICEECARADGEGRLGTQEAYFTISGGARWFEAEPDQAQAWIDMTARVVGDVLAECIAGG